MAENVTRPTEASVDAFLDAVPDARRRAEGKAVRELMERVTGSRAVMWGPTMVGFGTHHYRYATGREGDEFIVGFAPRKAALTLYGIHNAYEEPNPLLAELGPHTAGKACVYVKRLDAIDQDVLERLVRTAWERYAKDTHAS
jgi:hypothetical protein